MNNNVPEKVEETVKIKFLCPFCDKRLNAPDHIAGRLISCPICKKKITVPENSLSNTEKNDKIVEQNQNDVLLNEKIKTNDVFPKITITGGKINPKEYIEKGTKFDVFGASLVAILAVISGTVFSSGILLIALLISSLFVVYKRKKDTALIHASGIHVSNEQFSEIYRCVSVFKTRLDLEKNIDIYIVESNIANAMTAKYGKKM